MTESMYLILHDVASGLLRKQASISISFALVLLWNIVLLY